MSRKVELSVSARQPDRCKHDVPEHFRTTLPNGMKAVAEGVFVYKVNDQGQLVSLRAFSEFEQTMASLTA